MKRALKKADIAYWNKGKGVIGYLAYVSGDLTGVWGNLTGVSGDLTGVNGNLTSVNGNIDDCELTDDDRKNGVDIKDLILRKEVNHD